jgi:hypothetical protein
MWAILDVILELLAELLLQIVGEALLELGWESFRTRRARRHPAPATLGRYLMLAWGGCVFDAIGRAMRLPTCLTSPARAERVAREQRAWGRSASAAIRVGASR